MRLMEWPEAKALLEFPIFSDGICGEPKTPWVEGGAGF